MQYELSLRNTRQLWQEFETHLRSSMQRNDPRRYGSDIASAAKSAVDKQSPYRKNSSAGAVANITRTLSNQ